LKKIYFILFIFFSTISTAHNESSERLKAVFIYNFIRYIDFPDLKTSDNLIIGVKDSPDLLQELLLISKIKKSQGSHAIIVKDFKENDEDLNILYIGKNHLKDIEGYVSMAHKKHVLIITDIEHGVKKGAAIELIINENKAEFDISKHNIKDCKLNVYRELLDLARNIE